MAQSNQVNLEIDEEETVEATPRHNFHRQDSREPRQGPSRNNLGLGDRLNSVFREIRPLVEHARMVNMFYCCYNFCLLSCFFQKLLTSC